MDVAGARVGIKTVREREVQSQIRDYLRWRGWYVVKIHQSLGSVRGIADLYALKGGRHVWIEVKTPRGRQSDAQREFQAAIESHGGVYMLASSIEDVQKALEVDKP